MLFFYYGYPFPKILGLFRYGSVLQLAKHIVIVCPELTAPRNWSFGAYGERPSAGIACCAVDVVHCLKVIMVQLDVRDL